MLRGLFAKPFATLNRPWRSARLWVRLALGFGALLTIMVAVVALAIMQFRALALHGEQMMTRDLQRMLKVQEIDQHVQSHGSAMARLLTSPRSERETLYPVLDTEYAAIESVVDGLTRQTAEAEGAALLQKVGARRNDYRDVFIAVATEIEAGDVAGASAMFNGAGQTAMKALMAASKTFLQHEQQRLDARQRVVQVEISQSERLLVALALVAVTLSAVLAWGTTLSVSRPLQRVERAASRVADGDYTARIDVRSGDELGRVAKAMNTLAAAVSAREAEIENVAYVDRLTGLPNRSMLRRLANDGPADEATVLLIAVARLRTVNEVLGFETGDSLLVQVAGRLRAALDQETGPPDALTLARTPGGVLALLCTGISRAAVEALRERIDAAASGPLACDGHLVDVHLVFGLTDAADNPDVSIDSLLRRAELAVGDAKRQKRKWVWHRPADDVARSRQLSLLSSLRVAATSRHPDLSIAVNVSALDVRDATFADQVKQLAQRHRAPLDRLRLEITESSVMDDADRVLPVLHALRALGVQLSIDDFGTSYSSLAYLHRLPVSELKIDRSFVAGADLKPEARALLATIIELGHSLQMSVTAEGVERAEERDLLAALGCDVAQGYLICKPLAPTAAARYVDACALGARSVATA